MRSYLEPYDHYNCSNKRYIYKSNKFACVCRQSNYHKFDKPILIEYEHNENADNYKRVVGKTYGGESYIHDGSSKY